MFEGTKEPEALFTKKPIIKVKLKANKEAGEIEIDEETKLTGIPLEAWNYKLGNRSAIEWVLDQYKEVSYTKKEVAESEEKKVLSEKFNNYRFSTHKKKVIELLKKLATVSVETMKIIEEMKKES